MLQDIRRGALGLSGLRVQKLLDPSASLACAEAGMSRYVPEHARPVTRSQVKQSREISKARNVILRWSFRVATTHPDIVKDASYGKTWFQDDWSERSTTQTWRFQKPFDHGAVPN